MGRHEIPNEGFAEVDEVTGSVIGGDIRRMDRNIRLIELSIYVMVGNKWGASINTSNFRARRRLLHGEQQLENYLLMTMIPMQSSIVSTA